MTLINQPNLWQKALPKANQNSHKYNRGVVMICGSDSMSGATILAAKAAMRTGAGLVKISSKPKFSMLYRQTLISAILCEYNSMQAFKKICQDTRINAFLIGPGGGNNKNLKKQIYALAQCKKPIVLDADALNILNGDYQAINEISKISQSHIIITPHEQEFKRLFPTLNFNSNNTPNNKTKKLPTEKINAAKKAAELIPNTTIILKGNNTIIAQHNQQIIVNQHSSPYLATAGSGDVLAGIITAKIAQKMTPILAAAAATWIHGDASIAIGQGLIAEDLPSQIAKSLKIINNKLN